MSRNFHQSEKHFKCAGASLSLQIVLLFLTTSIPEGTGGSDDGDPAPGRSPGPPVQGYEISEDTVKISFGVDLKKKTDDSLWCKNYFSTPNSPNLNVSLHHPLFEVFTKLLPGLSYYVTIHEISNKESVEEIYVQSTTDDGFSVGTWGNKTSKRRCFDGEWTPINVRESIQWMHHRVNAINFTFRFRYRSTETPSRHFHEEISTYSSTKDCVLQLRQTRGSFGSADMPSAHTCRINFPRKMSDPKSEHKEGLLVELTRLNIPCSSGGFIKFVEESPETDEIFNKPRKLCGKLEELNLVERKFYFPSVSEMNKPYLMVHKNPVFSLNYHLVDYCYNVTFVSPNGSLVINPVKNLLCNFRVHLPYGNKVLLRLQMGEDRIMPTAEVHDESAQNFDDSGKLKTSSLGPSTSNSLKRRANSQNSVGSINGGGDNLEKDGHCDGLYVMVWDGSLTWNHCSKSGDLKRDIQVSSQGNVVTIKIVATASDSDGTGYPIVKFWYHAEPVTEIVGACEFGEILVKQFCVSIVQIRLDWEKAEQFCEKRGGHLASIRDESSQNEIDHLLIHSPEYREHNSYWIGASDRIYEGYFKWSDGFGFSYSNWFPGWSQQGFYNRQPNDDGFSHQDCVEIRRVFPHPSGSRIIDGITSSYLWNDLDCNAKNFFLCERLESGELSEQTWNQECNKTVTLTKEHPKTTVFSFGFPHQYPDNTYCETVVSAPSGYRLIIDFEELVIEKEPTCSYDYLELIEDSWNESFVARRLCDDMSDKLKLLRYTSQGPRLKFLFVSDYSHHFSGFKAKVSIESAGIKCPDEKYEMFNNSCYLLVSYPKVTWETASQICKEVQAELAGIQNSEEENFITRNIRNSIDYATSSAYWLGGYLDGSGTWKWTDGTLVDYTAWPSSENGNEIPKAEEANCLAVQWVSAKAKSSLSSSGLYWTPQPCTDIGGYICKKSNQASSETANFNKTLNGTAGLLMSPGYPNHYYNNLDYFIQIVGPIWTRMVVAFSTIDIENQSECLYDFIELKSGGFEEPQVRWCGNKTSKKNRSIFVSDNNEVVIRFHSDYSISGSGFYATWKAVDVSGCPSQKLTAREGIILSPNYGDFLLPRLDCTTIIIAPPGKRIYIEFEEIDLADEKKIKGTRLEVDLGDGHLPLQISRNEALGNKIFVSTAEKIVIRLKTSKKSLGVGYRATYRTVGFLQEEKIVNLSTESDGVLQHLNYPAEPPLNVNFVQHLITKLGYVIHLELHQVTLLETGKSCPGGNGIIEVTDNYGDENGTWWFLCEIKSEPAFSASSLAVTSYLNTLHIRQKSAAIGTRMNATIKVRQDPNYKAKLLKVSDGTFVESCRPNPCQNGGKCLVSGSKKMCQCIGHFIGMFCALTQCELEPCLFGTCELTGSGYKCHCEPGYNGLTCEKKQSPCEDNPCEGRGECMEKSDSFYCRCHAWWEGPRCEKRMMHIPFKPLSERMLQEPFWLGLITVFVVLAVIGLVWCAKRHFPEKLEKLLAEEADRNHRSNVSGLIRPPSIREPNAASGSVPVLNPSGAANCPRKLFGRLGIRKSSLLSLTSPQRPDRATSRTFSLDDLLRPTPRRTPSPRKKPNNAAPPKKNPEEKKQILQHLICPSLMQSSSEKNSPIEPQIVLHDAKRKSLPSEKTEWMETSFCSPSMKTFTRADFGKFEKKVTFAKLINKVSAEMSSSSEPETSNLMALQALSTPVSPALGRRFSQGICSNQGSDSLSSSEIAISGSAYNSLLDIPNNMKKYSKEKNFRNLKATNSGSVLDMFRSFSSTSVTGRVREITPSSTPSASSPPDELIISDESSILDTPISTTSGPFDSPCDVFARGTTIEIPVVDVLTAQKTAHSPPSILLEIPTAGNNKFLSPIREMPTPMPSPALTPIMSRIDMNKVKKSSPDSSDDEIKKRSNQHNENEKNKNFSESLIQVHREDVDEDEDDDLLSPTDEEFTQNNFLPTYAEENMNFFKNQSAVSEQRPNMVIPLMTIQEPSPPSTSPPGSYPGSPPPQKDMQAFIYSPVGSPRRSIKGPDKPNSLELPYPPPMITITCNISEPESDAEFLSPAPMNKNLEPHNPTVNNVGMTYLSPFSMCSRGDRTASESNLSSSGYSSMASPGPSRCGSNNPLCNLEVEDHQHSQGQSGTRFQALNLKSTTNSIQQLNEAKNRGRSDSETLSDDPLMESNDEGIGTDHLDDRTEDKEMKSLRDVEVFADKETSAQNLVDFSSLLVPNPAPRGCLKKLENLDCHSSVGPISSNSSLQLPTIVVQADHCDKLFSPVSSRSESPLSDKALGMGRFSPMFYSKRFSPMPFTDSDGLYDFPSSDCPPSNNKSVQTNTAPHKKSTGRKRERRNSHRLSNPGLKTSSPTKNQSALLEVPPKDATLHRTAQRKPSPKRKTRTQKPLSSSSSTESLTSKKLVTPKIKCNETSKTKTECSKLPELNYKSSEEINENSCTKSKDQVYVDQPFKRTIGFRAIGHQIRFLRRIEQSLKRKEKLTSCVDSEDDDEDDDVEDPSLSLLPQREHLKSAGISLLTQTAIPNRIVKKRNYDTSAIPRSLTSEGDRLTAIHNQND